MAVLQTRIKHLMVLVIYVAIELALLELALRFPGKDRAVIVLAAVIVSPLALYPLTLAIFQPGPRRDRVLGLLCAQFMLLVGLFGTGVVAAAVLYTTVQRSQFVVLVCLALGAFGGLFLGACWARRYLIPAPCPGCQRRGLVEAWQPRSDQGVPWFYWVRCDSCHRQDCVRWPQSLQGCPTCRQPFFKRRPYIFFWCQNCRRRFKRSRRGDWEDASSPDFDIAYSFWSPARWPKRVRAQTAGKNRTRA
jgi:hypothetical protein